MIAGSLAEVLGALTIGPFVAGTIAGDEIHASSFDHNPNLFALLMLSATISAGQVPNIAYDFPREKIIILK